jgi:hypothetical protein
MRRACDVTCDVTCDEMSMREGVAVPTGLTTGNVQRRVAREHEVRIWGSHDRTLHASDRFPEITGKSPQEISATSPRGSQPLDIARETERTWPSHIASTTLPFEVVPPSCSDCSRRVPLIGAPASLLFMRPRGVHPPCSQRVATRLAQQPCILVCCMGAQAHESARLVTTSQRRSQRLHRLAPCSGGAIGRTVLHW